MALNDRDPRESSDMTIDPEGSTPAAQEKLKTLEEFDGEHVEDVPEPLRNAYRGRRALQAVQMYADRDGNPDEEPVEQYVRDLLSDLMHLADLFRPAPDADGLFDFYSLMDRASYIHGDEAARP